MNDSLDNNNSNNNKNVNNYVKSKMLLIVLIFTMIIAVVGATYALIMWNSDNTTISGDTRCFGINYVKGADIDFGTVNSSGIVTSGMVANYTFDITKAASTYVSFERQNGCSVYGKGTITATITSSASLSTGALKYRIYNSSSSQKGCK